MNKSIPLILAVSIIATPVLITSNSEDEVYNNLIAKNTINEVENSQDNNFTIETKYFSDGVQALNIDVEENSLSEEIDDSDRLAHDEIGTVEQVEEKKEKPKENSIDLEPTLNKVKETSVTTVDNNVSNDSVVASSGKSNVSININNTKDKDVETTLIIEPTLDTSKANSGVVNIKYGSDLENKIKVLIEKEEKYYYQLESNGAYQSYSLNMGSGVYKIYLYENVSGTKYSLLKAWKVNASMGDENSAYLASTQNVNWNTNMSAINKADQLGSVSAIYNYIVSNVKYDYNKNVSSGYIPSVESIYSTKSGICYDYSTLFAAMARSVGIPTKVVKGYSNNVDGYHSWNQVYNDGKWLTIDISYDAQAKEHGVGVSMYKSSSDYSVKSSY